MFVPLPISATTISIPPLLDEMPISLGAILMYGLIIASIALVLYFGLKKPKGPSGMGHA